jgi:hypothetical protein
MTIPKQEQHKEIRSTFNEVLQVLTHADLGVTDYLTVLNMLEEHFEKSRTFILGCMKKDNCWPEK